jgi:hypothetical protein
MDEIPTLTCESIEEGDLVSRYVAGQLSEPEAEALEAHYFGCEKCWQAVRAATEIRASFLAPAGTTSLSEFRERRRRRPVAYWLAAAAALALVGIGVWRGYHPPSPDGSDTVVRGGGHAIEVTTERRDGRFVVQWMAVDGAASYRVRALSDDGSPLLSREVTGTELVLEASDWQPSRDQEVILRVEAFNAIGQRLAESRPLRVSQ